MSIAMTRTWKELPPALDLPFALYRYFRTSVSDGFMASRQEGVVKPEVKSEASGVSEYRALSDVLTEGSLLCRRNAQSKNGPMMTVSFSTMTTSLAISSRPTRPRRPVSPLRWKPSANRDAT